jgi:hypothetical protein
MENIITKLKNEKVLETSYSILYSQVVSWIYVPEYCPILECFDKPINIKSFDRINVNNNIYEINSNIEKRHKELLIEIN